MRNLTINRRVSTLETCPGNILSAISRLEVLIGEKRAGNNSVEIINEADDVWRRLFQGGIMDIEIYKKSVMN